ncbi:MAG: MFS transporter, partial [Chitinophagales bacterium]|nr:MFS transporter [Chitinophagales bacterium]
MKNEKLILYLITFMWFCAIVDFLLMLPLGTAFMKLYKITPRQYSLLIAAFSLAGFLSSFTASMYVDKLDRKVVFIGAFGMFAVGTTLCSFATTFELMLFSRFFTGLFGGLLGGVSTAIISDIVPYERRGKAMGILNLGFGVASIVGIPFSIFIYKHSDIFWPFRLVGILSFITLIPAYYILPSLTGHINKETKTFSEITEILKNRNLQKALLFAFLLVLGHFMFISFINPYLIDNLGFKEEDTMWMYIVGGISVSLTSPRMGKFIDTLGKLKSFRILILFSFIPILVISHLQSASIMLALFICAFMFIFNSGRMIAAMTLITGAPTEEQRGKFLVIRSSFIELSEGAAALIGGMILSQDAVTHRLSNYNVVGYVAVGIGIICIY